jgi:hypothetical protein
MMMTVAGYMILCPFSSSKQSMNYLFSSRLANPEDDDLWDFGTVKNVARQNTMTRIPPVSPDSGRRSLRSKNSIGSTGSVRRILNPPPLGAQVPPAVNHRAGPPLSSEDVQEESDQGTLRYSAPNQRNEVNYGPDEFDYPSESVESGDDTLTDATMLDSVVLPAIVSVSDTSVTILRSRLNALSCSPVSQLAKQEALSRICNAPSRMPKGSSLVCAMSLSTRSWTLLNMLTNQLCTLPEYIHHLYRIVYTFDSSQVTMNRNYSI